MDAKKTKKKKSAEKGSRDNSLWSSADGWRTFEAADELLLGAEEGGFGGLEVLDDISLIDADYLAQLNEQAKQQLDAEAAANGKPSKNSTKQQKQKQGQPAEDGKAAAAAAAGSKRKRADADAAGQAAADVRASEDDVAALKERLKQLEAENKALKKQKKPAKSASAPVSSANGDATPPASSPAAGTTAGGTAAASEGQAGEKKSRKQLKLEKHKQKQLERKQRLKEQRALQKQQKQQEQKQQTVSAGDASAAADVDMSAWLRFSLHPKLEAALAAQGFSSPTPIQDAVLLPAVRDRRDVIGAAQTGSGKTLAFGLPILQVLLQEMELQQVQEQHQQGADAAADATSGNAAAAGKQQGGPLRALILAPTRELALQVSEHLQTLGKHVGIRVAPLVGGIAPVKQERLLRACPPVVVATPGRLWDLIRHGHKHVSNLDNLSFFVLDEADRMVQQGHFQELSSIMELLPTPERLAAVAAAAAAEAEEQKRLEQAAAEQRAKLDRRQKRKQQESGSDSDEQADSDADVDVEKNDSGSQGGSEEEDDQQMSDADQQAGSSDVSDEAVSDQADDAGAEEAGQAEQQQRQENIRQQQQRRGKRKVPGMRHHLLQTFVFSATLTLPAQLHKRLRKGGGGSSGAASLESLMDRLSFRDRPAIVDLSPSTQLADRVTEGLLQTLEEDRDATLYYVLARHPGRALVFVNAVSAVRRVAALLQLLGLPAVALHAQQQQRQRLKALDRFKAHPHGVLVATDVAARGLDIPNVQIVVHYQLPASADTYIHRSGRTARTGGIDGVVLAMVTPSDASRWAALRRALEGQTTPQPFPIDDRVLGVAKQRVTLAAKIDMIQRQDRKAHAKATWARCNAEAAGIALSDSEIEDEGLSDLTHSAVTAAKKGSLPGKKHKAGSSGVAGVDKDSQTGAEKVHAAGQLAQGLAALQGQLAAAIATPLQPSISHKFFTGGMSAAAAAAAAAACDTEQPAGDDSSAENMVLKPQSVLSADVIAETVQLAARLKQSRLGQAAAAGGTGGVAVMVGGKTAKKKQQKAAVDDSKARRKAAAALAAAAANKSGAIKGLAGVAKKGKKGAKNAALQQSVMARMLMSNNERKRLRRQGGMVVVRPGSQAGVFGRDAQGVSALDALNLAR